MITTQAIRALLNDIENDRVERTISTTNTDKFGQAICAFANDLPDHRLSGYLFLGVDDDGIIKGINVTDELLKNVAAIANGFLLENGEKGPQKQTQKQSDLTENDEGKSQKPSKKPSKNKIPEFPSPLVESVYKAIKLNRKAKYSWLTDNLGVSESTILRAINELKALGYINPEHSKIKGEWQLLK